MKTEIQNDTEYIAARLKQFKLVDMRHQYEDIASEAESKA